MDKRHIIKMYLIGWLVFAAQRGEALQAIDLPVTSYLSNHKKTAALGVAVLLLGAGYICYKYKGGKNCGKETDSTGLDKNPPQPVPVNPTEESSDEADQSEVWHHQGLAYYLSIGRNLASLVDKDVRSSSQEEKVIAAIKKIDCVKIKSKNDTLPLEWEKSNKAAAEILECSLDYMVEKIGARDTSYKAYVDALKQITAISDDQGLTWQPVDWQAIEEAVKL